MASTRKRLEALTAGLMLPQNATDPSAAMRAVAESQSMPSASKAVETRFPPAAGNLAVPRTAPGQMMAFRGQIQQVESEMAALREKLAQYEGSLPTRKMDPQTVHPSRWANRHDASFATAEFARLKADIEHAAGNVQPILVRPLKDQPGHFEIVFGHRRHRACKELGIEVLSSVWTEELGDAALFAAMDRENRERADLSSYEQGLMYQRALEEHLFPTQRQLAEALGVSHTWVRKALLVAQLPPSIVECFRSPLDIGYRHAEVISTAMEKDRRGVLKRVERVRGRGLSPSQVVTQLADQKSSSGRLEKVELQVDDRKVGMVSRAKDGAISITISAAAAGGLPDDAVEKALIKALRHLRAA
jgi:ParB family chromosome partitioning protein